MLDFMITHWIQDLLPYIIWQIDRIKIVAKIVAKIQFQHHTRGNPSPTAALS